MSSEVEPKWLCSVQVPRQGGHKGVADEVKTPAGPSLERLRAAGTGAQGPGGMEHLWKQAPTLALVTHWGAVFKENRREPGKQGLKLQQQEAKFQGIFEEFIT